MRDKSELLAYIALFFTPLFFSSNVVFGRLSSETGSFTLAALRWTFTALILLLITYPAMRGKWHIVKENIIRFFILGFLGMWICGAIVYLALKDTSATNGVLIYTSSPIVIILFEKIFRGRAISSRELIGIILAIIGVVWIVSEGNLENLINLSFNKGDLYFVAAAISWAAYSLMIKSKNIQELPTIALLGITAAFGAVLVWPVAFYELGNGEAFPNSLEQWSYVAGIVLFASIISFSTYQYGIKIHGPSIASIFMYLLPIAGMTLAWFFLGEVLQIYHYLSAALVLIGVIISTMPSRFWGLFFGNLK